MSSLFAVFLLMVSLSDHFANCGGNIEPEILDIKPGCSGNECEVPKPCRCHKPEKKCEDGLLNMTRYGYFKMRNRVFRSKDINAHYAMDACFKTMLPPRVEAAFKNCAKKIVGTYNALEYNDALAAEPVLVLGVYECVEENARHLTSKEKKQMLVFEKCVKKIKPRCGSRA